MSLTSAENDIIVAHSCIIDSFLIANVICLLKLKQQPGKGHTCVPFLHHKSSGQGQQHIAHMDSFPSNEICFWFAPDLLHRTKNRGGCLQRKKILVGPFPPLQPVEFSRHRALVLSRLGSYLKPWHVSWVGEHVLLFVLCCTRCNQLTAAITRLCRLMASHHAMITFINYLVSCNHRAAEGVICAHKDSQRVLLITDT